MKKLPFVPTVEVKIPKKSRYWRFAIPMLINGQKATLRERLIYEAGFNAGSKKLEEKEMEKLGI